MDGKLYIVPTPVGNLGDMTPRAIEVLKTANLILAEDTRTSATLMRHFGIDTPMVSHHKYNEHNDLSPLLDRMASGQTIALISDAGTPGISDPGFMLSRECRRNNIPVETLPGATAFVPALINSGLPCDRFFFEGFLPPKKGRATRLAFLASLPVTFIIYESPLRLLKTLDELAQYCGEGREASVSREISKLHDTTERGTLATLRDIFTVNQPKGEIVIIVAPEAKMPKVHSHKNKYRCDNDEETD